MNEMNDQLSQRLHLHDDLYASLANDKADTVACPGGRDSTSDGNSHNAIKSPLLELPDDQSILTNILSYLSLKCVLRMRLVCTRYRSIICESAHHLWMETGTNDGGDTMMSARRMRVLLEMFPRLRSLRLVGLRLVYHSLIRGAHGTAANPRYICSLLREAECSSTLECLELLDTSDEMIIASVSDDWGAASEPSYSIHTDIHLAMLNKLAITGGGMSDRENPLVHSLLRSSRHLTHLNLSGLSCIHDYHVESAILAPLRDSLVHLNLSGNSGLRCPKVQSEILQTLVLQQCITFNGFHSDSCCPSLNDLDLSECPRLLSVLEQGFITSFCPRVSKLKLRHCTSLRCLLFKFPHPPTEPASISASGQLECIDLSMCVHLENVQVSCHLKSVDLRGCFHLGVLSIQSPVLERLDLSRLPLRLVSLRCEKLVYLDLSGCDELDSKRSIIMCDALQFVDIRDATYLTPEFFDSVKCERGFTILRN